MSRALSFDQAPPFSVPLRFFLTAPLFGMAAGVVALLLGEEGWGSRWSPGCLVLTHLLTTGFMLQIMFGALLQMLPVAIGTPLQRPGLVAGLAHPLLAIGTITLCLGFFLGTSLAYQLAVSVFALGVTAFFGPVAWAVFDAKARGATVVAFRLAIAGFGLTAGLGAVLAAARAGVLEAEWLSLTSAHVAAGWIGWGGMLVVGAAYLVVPMFQLTPEYPKPMLRWFAGLLAITVLLWVMSRHYFWADLLAVGMCCFAVITVGLQQKRRRKRADVSLRFWQLGMAAMLVAALLWALLRSGFAINATTAIEESLGALVLLGVFSALICGMVYKIVPFISWLHLQGMASQRPQMNQFISEGSQYRQLKWHAGATLLLGLAPWIQWMGRPGGLALVVSFGLLEWNLVQALRVFRESSRSAKVKEVA